METIKDKGEEWENHDEIVAIITSVTKKLDENSREDVLFPIL